MCNCCKNTDGSIVLYSIRGIDGTPYSGRVFLKGTIICDDCANFFISI